MLYEYYYVFVFLILIIFLMPQVKIFNVCTHYLCDGSFDVGRATAAHIACHPTQTDRFATGGADKNVFICVYIEVNVPILLSDVHRSAKRTARSPSEHLSTNQVRPYQLSKAE